MKALEKRRDREEHQLHLLQCSCCGFLSLSMHVKYLYSVIILTLKQSHCVFSSYLLERRLFGLECRPSLPKLNSLHLMITKRIRSIPFDSCAFRMLQEIFECLCNSKLNLGARITNRLRGVAPVVRTRTQGKQPCENR